MIPIGVITLGQTPRVDLIPEFQGELGSFFDLIQCGALDTIQPKEIPPLKEDERALVSRLKNGEEVRFSPTFIHPYLQSCVDMLIHQRVELIILLCTGQLPPLESSLLLIEPNRIIEGVVGALAKDCSIDLIVPHPRQVKEQLSKRSRIGLVGNVVSASPYGSRKALVNAATYLKKSASSFVLLDCMGYSQASRQLVMEITGKRVLLPRSLVAAMIRQLF